MLALALGDKPSSLLDRAPVHEIGHDDRCRVWHECRRGIPEGLHDGLQKDRIAPRHLVALSAIGACVTAFILSNLIALEFAFGIAVAVAVRRKIRLPGPAIFLTGAIILVTAGACLCLKNGAISNDARTATFGTGAALLLYSVVVLETRGATFPRLLRYAGDISYSVYVWHVLILTWIRPVGPRAPEMYKTFVELANFVPGLEPALLLLFIVTFSAASFACIERPAPALRLVRVLRSNDAKDLVRNDGGLYRGERAPIAGCSRLFVDRKATGQARQRAPAALGFIAAAAGGAPSTVAGRTFCGLGGGASSADLLSQLHHGRSKQRRWVSIIRHSRGQ